MGKTKMKKLMVIAGAVALAGIMVGCATTGGAEDKVAAFKKEVSTWQKERTPVAVLKSKISVKAARAIVEALDVAPFGLYKPLAEKCDFAFDDYRYHVIISGYNNNVAELVKQGKSQDEAKKEAWARIDKADRPKVKAYIEKAQKNNWQERWTWCAKMGEEVANATQKFAQESPNALNQIVAIAQKEGGMAAIKIPAQGKDDLAVIGDQLKDAGIALKYYKQIMSEIEADSKETSAADLEALENGV